MKFRLLLMVIPLILTVGCQATPTYELTPALTSVSANDPNNLAEIAFEVTEGNSLTVPGIPNDAEFIPGRSITLYGDLVDTGSLNMFYVYTFDGVNVFSVRYYLKDRIYTGADGIWVTITGIYSTEELIEAGSFEKVDEIDKKVEEAREYACEWVAVNRTSYDLNNYKRTNRFKELGFSASDDLNKAEFRPDNQVVFIDSGQMIAGFDCGKSVLRESRQRGDYLTYMALYDLSNAKLIRVIIKNTGYFLE